VLLLINNKTHQPPKIDNITKIILSYQYQNHSIALYTKQQFEPCLAEVSLFFLLWRKGKSKPLLGHLYYSSAFIIICPKVWMGKYQDAYQYHLVLDGVNSHMFDRKTNTIWQRFLFSFSWERAIQRNLDQAG